MREDPVKIARILTYEIGDIHKCMVRGEMYPSEKDVWDIELKVALIDSMRMLDKLATLLGHEPLELRKLGALRESERLQDIEERGRMPDVQVL